MVYRSVTTADKMLLKIDRRFGVAAALIVTSGTTIDDMTSGDVNVTTTSTSVIVNELQVNDRSIEALPTVNAADVEKMFSMRSAYASDVKQGDIIKIGSDEYQVVNNGSRLDALGLKWTIATYKRKV